MKKGAFGIARIPAILLSVLLLSFALFSGTTLAKTTTTHATPHGAALSHQVRPYASGGGCDGYYYYMKSCISENSAYTIVTDAYLSGTVCSLWIGLFENGIYLSSVQYGGCSGSGTHAYGPTYPAYSGNRWNTEVCGNVSVLGLATNECNWGYDQYS